MAEPFSSRFPLTHVNETVACGPCAPQFSRNALVFNRYFKVPVIFDVTRSEGDAILTISSAAGEKGRSNYGQGQVVSGFDSVIATAFYTNLYEDGAFADNDCFFRQYGWSMKIDPTLYIIHDADDANRGRITMLPNNYSNLAVGSSYMDALRGLFNEILQVRLVQRNSACEFDLGRSVSAPYPSASQGSSSQPASGLANVVGQEAASAICHPGNTGSKRPVFVIDQTDPMTMTVNGVTPIQFPEVAGDRLAILVEYRAEGEDIYGEVPG